jgi:hypothetical protein
MLPVEIADADGRTSTPRLRVSNQVEKRGRKRRKGTSIQRYENVAAAQTSRRLSGKRFKIEADVGFKKTCCQT